MKEHYMQLFQYEKWATGKVLDAMRQLSVQDEKCLEWMAHILMAQLVWYSRLVNSADQYMPWDKKTFEECISLYEGNTKYWEEYLKPLDEKEFARTITYKNTKGDAFENKIKDILTHVINHSTYHRGQIIAKLKGQLPLLPSTDYIFYIR
jgi:uncharacterized damage-inducible protein DinB